MLALRRWRCTPLQTSVCSRRSAHAATAPREDDQQNQAGPSNYYHRRSDPASGSGSGSGKGKSTSTSTSRDRNDGGGSGGNGDQKEYRFPVKGKAGGEPDPFEVMALDRTASPSDVKKQYYRLALLLHPDSSHPSSSPEHFASLHRAYTLLSSPAKRSSYVQTGYGWDATGKEGAGRGRSSHSYEDQMRAEIRYRAQGGTSGWHGRGRPTYGGHRYGYRESDAGRGAWGGFRGGDGKWEAYDTGEFSTSPGTGEERYMSNTQFLGLIAGISIALGWAQYHRFMIAKDQGTELLSKQHLDASHALAEARQEAAMFGKERRERIRRRVRESEVLKEVEQLELKGIE